MAPEATGARPREVSGTSGVDYQGHQRTLGGGVGGHPLRNQESLSGDRIGGRKDETAVSVAEAHRDDPQTLPSARHADHGRCAASGPRRGIEGTAVETPERIEWEHTC